MRKLKPTEEPEQGVRIRWLQYPVAVAICAGVPVGIVGTISSFRGGACTTAEKGWTMIWLGFGLCLTVLVSATDELVITLRHRQLAMQHQRVKIICEMFEIVKVFPHLLKSSFVLGKKLEISIAEAPTRFPQDEMEIAAALTQYAAILRALVEIYDARDKKWKGRVQLLGFSLGFGLGFSVSVSFAKPVEKEREERVADLEATRLALDMIPRIKIRVEELRQDPRALDLNLDGILRTLSYLPSSLNNTSTRTQRSPVEVMSPPNEFYISSVEPSPEASVKVLPPFLEALDLFLSSLPDYLEDIGHSHYYPYRWVSLLIYTAYSVPAVGGFVIVGRMFI